MVKYFPCAITLILILGAFLYCHSVAVSQWSRLLSVPTYGFYINPKNPNNIYVGGLGRKLYRTDNEGVTWDTLIVEFEDNSARFTNVLVSNEDTSVILVAGLGFGTVRRSSDRGSTWQTVIETQKPFFAPGEILIQHPGEKKMMVVGEFTSKIIYISKNEGSTWDSIGKVMPGYDLNLCTLTPRLDSTNILYGGCTPGTVVRTTDMGKSWRIVSRLVKNEYGDAEIPKIIISKQNPAIMYAAVTYFSPLSKPNGGIYLSKDYGFTWKRIAFKDTSIWAIDMLMRNNQDEIWVGGFSEGIGNVAEVPGGGIISSFTTSNNIREIQKDIPWNTNISKSVWMLRFYPKNDGNNVVYFATEAGFLKYDYATNSLNTDELLRLHKKPYLSIENGVLFIRGLTNISNKRLTLHIYNLLGKKVFYQSDIGFSELQSGIEVTRQAESINLIIITDEKGTPILSEIQLW